MRKRSGEEEREKRVKESVKLKGSWSPWLKNCGVIKTPFEKRSTKTKDVPGLWQDNFQEINSESIHLG